MTGTTEEQARLAEKFDGMTEAQAIEKIHEPELTDEECYDIASYFGMPDSMVSQDVHEKIIRERQRREDAQGATGQQQDPPTPPSEETEKSASEMFEDLKSHIAGQEEEGELPADDADEVRQVINRIRQAALATLHGWNMDESQEKEAKKFYEVVENYEKSFNEKYPKPETARTEVEKWFIDLMNYKMEKICTIVGGRSQAEAEAIKTKLAKEISDQVIVGCKVYKDNNPNFQIR